MPAETGPPATPATAAGLDRAENGKLINLFPCTTYTIQRLLELRRLGTRVQNDTFYQLKRLGIVRETRQRDVSGSRRSCSPSRHSSRRQSESVQRCLALPPRLSLRQTEAALKDTEAPSAAAIIASNITIELLNVQSLLPKMPGIVAELGQKDAADILCFTETNLKAGTPNRFISLPGYRVFRQDRKLGRKKSGGGVAIYVRDTLKVTRITAPAPPGAGQSHTESLWVSVKLNKKRATTIGCIYRPPSTGATQVDADYDDLEEQLQALITAHPTQRIALVGDLNSDNQTSSAAHRRLLQLAECFGLSNVVHQPTFYRGDTQSILDVVLLARELYDTDVTPVCTVEPCHFVAHHRRVIVHLRIPRVRPPTMYRTSRNWRVFDDRAFLSDVSNRVGHCLRHSSDRFQQLTALMVKR